MECHNVKVYSKYTIPSVLEIGSTSYTYNNEELGRGGNGFVLNFIGADSISYAVKIIPLYKKKHKENKRVAVELQFLKTVSHDHIIKFKGSKAIKILDHDRQVDAMCLVFEKADCNLKELISETEVSYSSYILQFVGLCKALCLLHTKGVHRDIKPENILVIGDKWVISDFGLCAMTDGNTSDITPPDKAIGPRYWLSPEAHSKHIGIDQHTKKIDFHSDIYQMCAIFWFIINRRHPSGLLVREDFVGPEHLYPLIVRGLQHDKERRYASTQEFRDALEKVIHS